MSLKKQSLSESIGLALSRIQGINKKNVDCVWNYIQPKE